jgi:NadR type nicotinamide-nucleotide adenylyltransferase
MGDMAQTHETASRMKRIAITGPECTGKTMLAQQLAAQYKTVWVREYAREYLDGLSRRYEYDDIIQIARGQVRDEDRLAAQATGFLFCDTCLLVCKVWSLVRFGRVDAWITEMIEARPYDLYILPQPDIEWTADTLRENPADRWDLLERYRDELKALGRPWIEVSGSPGERVNRAIAALGISFA